MSVYKIIDSASSTGAGTVFKLSPNDWSGVGTLHLVVEADTNLSDWVCELEGGLLADPTYFHTIEQVDYTNDKNAGETAGVMHFEKQPVVYFRGNLTTLTGTGTVSVYYLVQPLF